MLQDYYVTHANFHKKSPNYSCLINQYFKLQWVGISCADAVKMKPGSEDNTEYEGWEQRAVERRAQQLATELAEQLFQEREEELTKRAREIVESGPPPCECNIKGFTALLYNTLNSFSGILTKNFLG